MAWYQQWKPYVPVAKRRAKAARFAAQLAKKEKRSLSPVAIEGRSISKSFWGQAWCDHLEQYSDYENRLPRGRTYVRNGSVIDLRIDRGKVQALVSGSDIYHVTVTIGTLANATWKQIKHDCSRSIDSLIDLLQGRFDQGVMQRLTQRKGGLFPQPTEIKIRCSCPDSAGLCKHSAAVLYGVGARLDTAPEMLFTLRGVDHLELVTQAVAAENLDRTLRNGQTNDLAGSDLGELFGIDLQTTSDTAKKSPRRTRLKASTPRDDPGPKQRRQPAASTRKALATKSAKSPARAVITKAATAMAQKLGKRPLRAVTTKPEPASATAKPRRAVR